MSSEVSGLEIEGLDRVIGYVQGDFKRWELNQRYRTDPAAWAYDKLGITFHEKQVEVSMSVVENRNTAVAAGHGTGKSFNAAILSAWWVDTHPLGTAYVATTAPTNDQISEIIFRELKALHSLSEQRVRQGAIPPDWQLPGRVGEDNTWKIQRGGQYVTVMKGRKPPDNKAGDAFQGLHARYVLAIGDEATGLTEEMIDGLGNITTGENNRRLLISNPTNPFSYLGKLFLKPTITDSGRETWNLLHVSVFDLPTMHGRGGMGCTPELCEKYNEHHDQPVGLGYPREMLESLSGPRFVEDKRAEYGEDSARYISRVLGQFAFEAGNTLFGEDEINTAVDVVVEVDYDSRPVLGVDVARFGADSTVVYSAEGGVVMRRAWANGVNSGAETRREPALDDGGNVVRGIRLRKVDSWNNTPLVTQILPDGTERMGTAEKVHNIAIGMGASSVRVDASGLGGGVVDRLWALSQGGTLYEVVEVLGGAASPDRRQWYNQRAFAMDDMRRMMFQGTLDVDARDEQFLDELMGITYDFADAASGGGMKIESKEAMKRRGVKSPDHVDAAWYACLDLSGVSGMMPGDTFTTPADMFLGDDRSWWTETVF